MRSLLLAAACAIALCGCSSKNIIELNTVETRELQNTGSYYVLPLEVSFKPPLAWDIPDDEWKLWVEQWRLDYKTELQAECYKKLVFVDSVSDNEAAVVSCDIYEMDKGGFSGIGGNGFARARIVVNSMEGRVIYDAKLEGTGANSGFESAVIKGRMKFAVLNLARQIADTLETGK